MADNFGAIFLPFNSLHVGILQTMATVIKNFTWNTATKDATNFGLLLQAGSTPNGFAWQVFEINALSNNGPAASLQDAMNQADAWAKQTNSYRLTQAGGIFDYNAYQWFQPEQP